jgi:hypothetical protein
VKCFSLVAFSISLYGTIVLIIYERCFRECWTTIGGLAELLQSLGKPIGSVTSITSQSSSLGTDLMKEIIGELTNKLRTLGMGLHNVVAPGTSTPDSKELLITNVEQMGVTISQLAEIIDAVVEVTPKPPSDIFNDSQDLDHLERTKEKLENYHENIYDVQDWVNKVYQETMAKGKEPMRFRDENIDWHEINPKDMKEVIQWVDTVNEQTMIKGKDPLRFQDDNIKWPEPGTESTTSFDSKPVQLTEA